MSSSPINQSYSTGKTATSDADEHGKLGSSISSDIPSLPKGARAADVQSSGLPSPRSPQPARRQAIPEEEEEGAQYARYPDNEKGKAQTDSSSDSQHYPLQTNRNPERDRMVMNELKENRTGWSRFFFGHSGWTPLPLMPIFWVPFVILLIALGVILEVVLIISNRRNGWRASEDIKDPMVGLHYAVILPPSLVASAIGFVWVWTNGEIKKMAPYIDLVHGDSPAKKSLLLDYSRRGDWLSWLDSARNKHYLVTAATIFALITTAFSSLAAALITVKVIWLGGDNMSVHAHSAIGLNQDSNFNDLTSFLTAAGYASSAVLYDLGDIPFVQGKYTVAPFDIPSLDINGTATVNTTAVKSEPGCQAAVVNMTQATDGSGSWTNFASLNGCSLTFNVQKTTPTWFGSAIPECDSSRPEASQTRPFRPVMFWFFTYQPTAKASATICHPSISLVNVEATVDIRTGNLTKVTEWDFNPFTPGSSDDSQYAGNITGPPLNGQAYNGIEFNISGTDPFVLARANATQLQLPAAAFQMARQDSAGLVASFDSGKFPQWSDRVYGIYMTLIAKTVYFLPTDLPVTVEVRKFENRIFLSAPAVHLLAAAFFLLAIGATAVHVLHMHDRRDLRLKHEPGTLAAAMAIGGMTPTAQLISEKDPTQSERKLLVSKLRDGKFRLDPHTNKLVMLGEEHYGANAMNDTRMTRGDSLIARLTGHPGRTSRRYSTQPPPPIRSNELGSVPASPLTPNPRTPNSARNVDVPPSPSSRRF